MAHAGRADPAQVKGQEASSASVIEAVRLSNSLAGMRGRPLPGLDETLESIQAVFCQGDPLPLDFLNKKLLIGDRLGELPGRTAGAALAAGHRCDPAPPAPEACGIGHAAGTRSAGRRRARRAAFSCTVC